MRAHVFITDNETYPIVKDNSFYGVRIASNTYEDFSELQSDLNTTRAGQIGDILGTRIGDVVFLYEKGAGFHGIYQISSKPFFDTTPIDLIGVEYPLRVEIECSEYFTKPVPEDYLFSTKEYEATFWAWFYKKTQPYGGSRAITTINPEATGALIELLVKVNGNANTHFKNEHCISSNKQVLELPLPNGKIRLEAILRAWLVKNIDNPDKPDIRDIFGPVNDIEWFANNVPYHVTGKNIDILCFHSNFKYTGFDLRYKYSVVELKRDKAIEKGANKHVTQLIEYSKWVGGRLANGDIETVQPILIANDFSEEAIRKARKSDFNDRGIKLVKYTVNTNDIIFEIVPL